MDEDNLGAAERDLGCGRVDVPGDDLGKGDAKPEELPNHLEQQHGEPLHRVSEPEEREQGYGGEKANGDPFGQRQGVEVREERPLDERKADPVSR